MSAILDLITREQAKLDRRKNAVTATEEEIKILGDSPKLQKKLARQKAFVKESQDNIKKLNAAAK